MKLALFGGSPLIKNHEDLRVDWPIVDEKDFEAVKKVWENREFSGRGSKEIYELERIFSKKFGNKYATALNSGTAALHASLLSVGIEPGDEVIVPNLTFVATASAVLYALAIPIFADVDPISYNILPEEIEKKISKKTKAVIVVHLHGFPAQMKEILTICRKHNLKLIEDVAQATGAKYHGRLLGTFGDAAIFSLMSQKNLATCGECGILLTSTIRQKNRAEMLRIYGEIFDKKNKARIYNSYSLGWNYTLNPIQAAVAITQLKKFDRLTSKIQKKARLFNKLLSQFDWIVPPKETVGSGAVFHFYRIKLQPDFYDYNKIGRFRKAVQEALDAEGLNVRHYQNIPVSGQVIFQKKRAFGKQLPWSLNANQLDYNIYSYPNTLDVLRSTLIIGAIGSSPAYLLCDGTIEKYVEGFKKIEKNMEQILSYADKMKYHEPWEYVPMTSDSYKTNYRILD